MQYKHHKPDHILYNGPEKLLHQTHFLGVIFSRDNKEAALQQSELSKNKTKQKKL